MENMSWSPYVLDGSFVFLYDDDDDDVLVE